MKKQIQTKLKNRKTNGISILFGAVILTISIGMLTGCSSTKEDTRNKDTKSENTESESTRNVLDQSEIEESQTEQISVNYASDNDNSVEDTILLTFTKEGEEEQKQASLAMGEGYFIYLPDEEWQQSDTDTWTATVNEQVRLWITHYKDNSLDLVDQELSNDGYETLQDYQKQKQEGDLIYQVGLKEFDKDIWGIFYCYPMEAEAGWGRELPVIADTFAPSAGAENQENNHSEGTSGYLGEQDCQEIRTIMEAFATAYFDGNVGDIQKFLSSTYEGEVDTYERTGTVSDITIKGLSDTDEKKIEDERCVVSLEFRDSNYEDMFLYLTVVFIKQEDNWKIQFYGIEG